MPILLKESQPYMIEVSHESMYKSRRDNLTHLKISEADLSGDMFFGNTEIMENIEGYYRKFLQFSRISMIYLSFLGRLTLSWSIGLLLQYEP